MAKSKIDKYMAQMIPYTEETLITIPLWEEGNYTPQINFWQLFDSEVITESNIEKIKKDLEFDESYELDFLIDHLHSHAISYDELSDCIKNDVNPLTLSHSPDKKCLYHFSIWNINPNTFNIIDLFELAIKTINYLRDTFKGKSCNQHLKKS
jgi:hypothetical protein